MAPITNLNYIIKTVENKESLIDVINLFLQQTQEDLCSINDAIMKTDYPNIRKIAYKIRSSTSVMGVSILSPILKRMEHLAGIASGIEEIKQLNMQVTAVYKQVIEELEMKKLKYF